jgi:hypothetical protein
MGGEMGGGGRSRRGGGGGGGGGGRRRGGRDGGGAEQAADASDGAVRAGALAPQRSRKLSIDQGAHQLQLVTDGTSANFTYGATSVSSSPGGETKTRSGWRADVFVVTLEVEKGPKITRTYEAVDEGSRLIVETVANGGRGRPERKTVSVYERTAMP